MKNFLHKYGLKIVTWIIFIISLIFFYLHFSTGHFIILFKQFLLLSDSHKLLLLISWLLFIINWLIESVKWKICVKPFEHISISRSITSVFTGITVSLFFPNRTGEFIGKILYLQKGNKIKGIVASGLSSIMQLSITIINGLFSFFILKNLIKSHQITILIATFLLIFIITLILNYGYLLDKAELLLSPKLTRYIVFLKELKFSTIIMLLILSFLRYIIFTLQLYLIFLALNIKIPIIEFYLYSSSTFLLTSILPTTSITELLVRPELASLFFTNCSYESIFISYSLLWFFNILTPAIIGSLLLIGYISLSKSNVSSAGK